MKTLVKQNLTTLEVSEFEFNKFEPRLKSLYKNGFQLSAGWNIETLNTILSGTNHIYAAT